MISCSGLFFYLIQKNCIKKYDKISKIEHEVYKMKIYIYVLKRWTDSRWKKVPSKN